MNQGFLFRITPANPEALQTQVSRALEQRTELKSRQYCPELWKITDRINAANEAAPKRPRLLSGFMHIALTLAGLILFTAFLMEPTELLVPGLLGAAGYFWGLFRTYHICRWSTFLILLLHSILTVVTGISMNDSGKAGTWLLCAGAVEAVVFLVLLFFSQRKKKESSFQRAAATLLEHRSQLPSNQALTVHFGPDGMDVNGIAFIPYERFEGIFETEDLFVCIYDEQVTVLQKAELTEGILSELEIFLAEQVSLFRVCA